MRRRRRRSGGITFGTVLALAFTLLVLGGLAYLLPKLAGDIDLRVDPQRLGVAVDAALRGVPNASVLPAAQPEATPATAPPLDVSTVAPAATPATVRAFSFTAGGSIAVDTQIQKTCTGADGYTFGPVFEALAPSLTGNLNLATLENLVVPNEKLTDVNMPADALAALRASGFDTLCTGFYGALNNGLTGLSQTLQAITLNGMNAYGVYPSQESRKHVVTLTAGDVTVALLSFQSELSAAGKKRTTAEEQAFVIAPLTLPTITADITAARAAGAQVVIVSLCWGKVGATAPSNTQKELAQAIANAGADVILGTHSGALQPVEVLSATRADGTTHQVLCAYSLGNLLESDRADRESISGALLHVNMQYDLAADNLTFESLTYTPTYVWRGRVDGKTVYRVLRSNAEPPAEMDSEQRKVMERCLKLVRDAWADSPVTEAQ